MKYLLIPFVIILSGCRHHGYRESGMCKTVHHGYGLATTKCYEKIQPKEVQDEAD